MRQRNGSGSVGLIGATAIGIGGMVGGGIFAVLGVVAVGAGGATPIAFGVAGAVAALTAFSYAWLSARHPSAGGTVAFVDQAFGIGELTGSLNVVLWAGYIVTIALYASAFGRYAATLFPGGTQPDPLLLRGLIAAGVLVPWGINLVSVRWITRSETLVVGIKLAILMFVVAAGVPALTGSRLGPHTWPSPPSILAAGMLVFVAYEGFELIANAGDDVVEPSKTLPRAFALSVGLVIALYVVISIVVIGSLAPPDIARSADFALAEAASVSLGRTGFTLVAVSAMLATFSAINATLYATARLSATIAHEGELPARLGTRWWHQPVGLHITALLALSLAVALPVESIAAMASAIFLAVFAVVNGAAFREVHRWGWRRIVAGAGVVSCAGSFVLVLGRTVTHDPVAIVVLAVLVASALTAEHMVLRRSSRTRRDANG
jgi:amino acid transporter